MQRRGTGAVGSSALYNNKKPAAKRLTAQAKRAAQDQGILKRALTRKNTDGMLDAQPQFRGYNAPNPKARALKPVVLAMPHYQNLSKCNFIYV